MQNIGLSSAVSQPSDQLSQGELILLEIEMLAFILDELSQVIKKENKDYLRILKLEKEKEKSMIQEKFIRCLIQDIIASDAYTLTGIAHYTDTPEDIIFDVATGQNPNPTFMLSQKIIQLHRSVRPELYEAVVKKMHQQTLQ